MSLDDKWDVRGDILNVMSSFFREDPNKMTSDFWIANTIFPKHERNYIISEMKLMEEDNLLKKAMPSTTDGASHYVVTSEGVEETSTTYNKEWQEIQQRKKRMEIGKERSEKKSEQDTEERRHKEMLKVAKEANRGNVRNTIIAGIIGFLGLIVAIVALLKD